MALIDPSMVGFTTTTVLLVVVLICLVLLVRNCHQKSLNVEAFEAKYPPGPAGLPILGNLASAWRQGWIEKQTKIYGDMWTFKMGTIPIIYLHGKALKDALNFGNFVSGRAPVPAMAEYFKGNGKVYLCFNLILMHKYVKSIFVISSHKDNAVFLVCFVFYWYTVDLY